MKPASRLILAILCAFGSGGLPLKVMAAPEIKRPELRFTTRTREPVMVGVQELIPPGSPGPAISRYYRILSFSGERQSGTGPVLGKPGECPGVMGSEFITPEKRRSQLRGQIIYAYDPVADGPTYAHGATEHKAVLYEPPWRADSCNPPVSPLPISILLPETGTPIPYGQSYIPDNNPLGLAVSGPMIAGDDGQYHYADYIGDGNRYYPTHWHDTYRLELQGEDLPDVAEQRARVATIDNELDLNAQTSIRGSRLNGTRWKIREVEVEERLDSCPGTYEVTRTYERRLIGAPAWEAMPAENARVEILPGAPPLKVKLPQKVGDEIRLTSVTYRTLSGNCSECTFGGPPGGGPPPGAGSIVWNLALGKTPDARVAGYLSLSAPQLSSGLYGPGALHALVDETYSRVIRDPQAVVRQVLTPETFGDIVVTSAQSYEIRFYDRVQASAPGADGFYVPSGNPYLFWRIENPDPGGAPGRWRVTRFMTGQNLVTEVDETQPGHRVFSEANGLRVTDTTFTVSGGDRTETIIVKNATGEVASKKTVVYRAFGSAEQPIKEILDPDGTALTTEWTYVTDSNSRAFGQVLTIKRPDGFVESFSYANGILVEHATPVWKQGSTVTRSDRSLVDLDNDGKIDTLTQVREGVDPYTRMGMGFTVEWGAGGIRDSYRAVDPNASWNTPSNIRTREIYDARGELTYRLNPDGTSRTRQFGTGADGGRIVTEEQRGTDGAGTRTVQTSSARGLLVSTVVTDLATGRLLESTTVTEMDSFGRALRIVHTDGAEEVRTYCDSCGGLESVTLRGERTNFIYDRAGRKIEEIHSVGSTVLSQSRFAYDAEGRLLRHLRVDPATGAETVLAATTYDLAGRVTSESSLGRGTTTYRYAFAPNNMTVTTTTFADGGTRSETRGASGALVSVRGTAVPSVDYEWTTRDWWGGGIGYIRNIRRLNDDGSTANEDQSINFIGEVESTTFSDGARSYRYFDSIGRPSREVDPDGVTTLHAYDAQGRPAVTAMDANRNGVIDYAGSDRITRTLSAAGERDGVTVQRTTTEVWATEALDAPTVVSILESSADGLRTWQTTHGLTTSSVTAFNGAGGRTVTTTAPDGVQTVQTYFSDRLLSTVVSTAAGGQLSAATFDYDSAGRLRSTTDAHNGATIFTYDSADRPATVTTPEPDPARSGDGYDPQVTRYTYDSMGRLASTTQPDGGVINTTYWPNGQVKRTWGARTYPVENTYDVQGRLKTVTTWQNFAGDAGRAVTTWNYDNARGFLQSKRYADGIGPNYAYTAAGRLRVRTWARGLTTTYTYTNAGDLGTTDYSDATPDVTVAYDRAGRPKTIADGNGSRALSYHSSGQFEDETYTAGLLNGFVVDRSFDALHRLSGLSTLSSQLSTLSSVSYSYDAASRLATVTSGQNTVNYTYETSSPLVQSVAFAQNNAARLVTIKSYDKLNRLASIINTLSSQPSALSYNYTYNSANQRTRAAREDSSYWSYHYDPLGQVTAGKKFQPDNAALPGHDYAWSYDDIGNRKTATVNGQVSTVSANAVNQYAQRTIPGVIGILGSAATDAKVAVGTADGAWLAQRQGDFFYQQIPVDNTSGPVSRELAIAALKDAAGPNGSDLAATTGRFAFVPKTPEAFAYDADGNLKSDARWDYTWDGENRLVRMTARPEAIRGEHRPRRVDYTYDGRARRIEKRVEWPGAVGLNWNVTNYSQPYFGGTAGAPHPFGALNWNQMAGGDIPSARFEGTLRVPVSGAWTIKLEESGAYGYRLYVDGQVRFEAWPEAPDQAQNVTLALEAGRDYAIRLDFSIRSDYRWWMYANVHLKWSGPGVSEELIPGAWFTEVSPYDQIETTRFLYDGWNLLAEFRLNPVTSSLSPVASYVWGLDLSGSLQGAGGVGGLLAVTDLSAPNSQPPTHFPAYDGNGNVAALVRGTDGAISASYDYTPFGETILTDGPFAPANPFRFSTKYTDAETGHLYYGYRCYAPEMGRWLNRDPIEEKGGLNLYEYAENDPVSRVDPLGLWSALAHDYLLDYAFRARISREKIEIMQTSSREFDIATATSVDLANMHSMRNAWQTPDQAKASRDAIVMNMINGARKLRKACREKEAHQLLGQAFHAVMDSTSQEHVDDWANPKVWRGLRDGWGHSAGEDYTIGHVWGLRGNEDARDITPQQYYTTAARLVFYYNIYLKD